MITDDEASLIASQWHSVMTWSDPGVAMYSVTSTGRVHNEEHRKKLLAYIDSCIPNAEAHDSEGTEPILMESNVEDLRVLRDWAAAFEVTT